MSIDILIFAVIAVVLLFRLRSVLGERNDDEPKNIELPPQLRALQQAHENEMQNGSSNVIAMHDMTHAVNKNWAHDLPNYGLVETATAHNRLAQLLTIDPSFRPDDFLGKAQKAYEMIIEAFATNARTTLEFLVAPPLLQRFVNQLDVREQQQETYHVEFHGLQKAVVTDAELTGTVARITVDFSAEQSITHKDGEGRVVNNHDGSRETTRDRWVFQKDLKDPSPSWLLVSALDVDE